MKYLFSFEAPKKIDVLLIDNNYANLKIKKLKTHIFDYKKIFFFIFLDSLIKFFFFNKKKFKLKEIYFRVYLKKTEPKIIIGHHENYLIFLIKKYSPNSIVIVYLHHRLFKSQADNLAKKAKFSKIDYFEARHSENLELIQNFEENGRLFAAVWLGSTRLIDNLEIKEYKD